LNGRRRRRAGRGRRRGCAAQNQHRVVADQARWANRLRHRKAGGQVRARGQFVGTANAGGLADIQSDATGFGAYLDAILLGRDAQGAIRVIDRVEGGSPNADGRCGGSDLVIGPVALADQAGDGAHAAAQEVHEEVILGRIAAVFIVGQLELRIGGKRYHAAIGKPELSAALRSRDDGVATLDGAAFRERARGTGGSSSRDFAACELSHAGRPKALQWIDRGQGKQQ
jgi:hypothetical protein